MKALLYIAPSREDWCLKYFPGRSPGELPLAGKTWCRHTVDQCSHLNVSDVYVMDCFFREDLARRMGDGQYWSLRLHFSLCIPCALPEQLLSQSEKEIPQDEDLLLFWGQVLPDIPDVKMLLSQLREVEKMPEVLPEGIYLLRKGKLYECVCPLLRMGSLQEYFDANFRLLKNPGIYNLPGYQNSEGCVFGMDVMILPGCELESPVLLLDNVRLERGTHLSGGVIVGRDVLINEGSSLEHSIVLDHTYIGRSMLFRGKIIDGVRVIDVSTGAYVDLEDEFLTGSSRLRKFSRFDLAEYLLAFLLALGGLPLFLVTFPFRKPLNRLAFFFFTFQAYPKCWEVLFGKAHLVRFGPKDPSFAFRYSDQWLIRTQEHLKIADDVYYCHNRNISRIFATVFRSLLKRLFVFAALPSDDRSLTETEGAE